MRDLRSVAVALLVLAAVAVGGVAVATAQDDAPGKPANFYGDAVGANGTDVPAGTTLVAVVDGTVEGEITVETAGTYGGDGAFDEKLSLDSAAGDEVSFHVGDAAGPAALDGPVALEPGTTERSLTFPAGAFDYQPPDPAQVVESIDLVLDATELESGATTDATVIASYKDGSTGAITDAVELSSENPAVATVDGATITGDAAGTTRIVAEYAQDDTVETAEIELTVESASGSDPGSGSGPGSGPMYSLELLGEKGPNHDHACLHGDHDERTPLDAGSSPDSNPAVSEDHVIWAVTYHGSAGYVTFDAGAYSGDSFVFYTAGGSVSPVDADILRSSGVPGCGSLDSYVEVEIPADGEIVLELSGGERTDSAPSTDPPGAQPDGQLEAAFDVDPSAPVTGENVTLSAGDSAADDAEIVSYDWVVDGAELTGERITTAFDSPGEKLIELTVETGQGETATQNRTINVSTPSAAVFEVTDVDVPENLSPGSRHTVTATIANTGGSNGTATIMHAFDGENRSETTVSLGPNETRVVEFEIVAPDTEGQYQLIVGTAGDDSSVTTMVVRVESGDAGSDDDTDRDGTNETPTGDDDDSSGLPGFGFVAAIGAILALLAAGIGRYRRK